MPGPLQESLLSPTARPPSPSQSPCSSTAYQPILCCHLSLPLPLHFPPSPRAVSTNHNQAAPRPDQSQPSTWFFPSANHVQPPVSAAASPFTAAAHQLQGEGDCTEPIRSCHLLVVPANQIQPHPTERYKGPSVVGLCLCLRLLLGGGVVYF